MHFAHSSTVRRSVSPLTSSSSSAAMARTTSAIGALPPVLPVLLTTPLLLPPLLLPLLLGVRRPTLLLLPLGGVRGAGAATTATPAPPPTACDPTGDGDAACDKPEFRPYRGWQGSKERARLQLQDTRGAAVKIDNGTGTTVVTLLTDQTYTIKAPKLLQQKDDMFVGYKQPYSKIKYELDFLLGAEVDIGCGTSVVGNGAVDENIPKSVYAHPLSMQEYSFQWIAGRVNLKADPIDYGYYPTRCPRYHRFRVTRPGNFTFVRAAAWRSFALKCYSLSHSFFLALLVFLLVFSPCCAPSPPAPLLIGLPHNGWLFHQLSKKITQN